MTKIIKDKRGEGYVDVMIFMIVIVMVISFIMDLMPIFVTKYRLDIFANEVVRAAEITGSTTSGAVNSTIANQRANTGINPNFIWERGGSKVQLGNEIILTLETQVYLSLFRIGRFPINLRARSSGLSEVYYK